jgi:hypothetical protein
MQGPPTVPAARRPRRRRRDRDELPPRFLLDGRLFRDLCAPGQPSALAGFRASLVHHRLAPEGALPPLEMTPLAVLDLLGIEQPFYDGPLMPPSAIKSGEAYLITGVVVQMSREQLEKAPELQAESLRKRVAELREQTNPEAHELFDLCLTRYVAREGFAREIQGQLAFDHTYKYRYPELVRELVFEFLSSALVTVGETVSGLSKVRAIKTVWDRSYERLLKRHPGARAEIQALDREMRLRTTREYLDWEAIHHSILGFAAADKFHPVVAFTPDSEEVLKARCVAYKSALRAYLDQIDEEELATTLRPKLEAWRPGRLVPCREDGGFGDPISTGELAVF